MNWFQSHRRSALICGLTLLVPLFIYLNVLFGFFGARAGYQADIDKLLPRIARLQGLIAYSDQLQESSSLAAREVGQLVYPASSDRASVSTALQTSVRQIFTDAGLSVSNSQVLKVREQDKFDYIGIRLSVAGDLADLDAALAAIAEYSPLLLVETLELRPGKKGTDDVPAQTILATVQLLSLRAVS